MRIYICDMYVRACVCVCISGVNYLFLPLEMICKNNTLHIKLNELKDQSPFDYSNC